MNQTHLLEQLRTLASAIAIETLWEGDEFAVWDMEDPSLEPDDFVAWNADVRVTAVVDGTLVHGEKSLGGIWEKYGEPHDAEIHGYFPGMLSDALTELSGQLGDSPRARYVALQCAWAIDLVTKYMRQPATV